MGSTTQDAPLEAFLARCRCRQVKPYIHDKIVLDFGCGINAWNSIAIQPLCKRVDGVDCSLSSSTIKNGISLYRDDKDIRGFVYDVIMALAVFEHIRPMELRYILNNFLKITHSDSIIVGTVPSPYSRKVLEFLSFKMGLIDRSQIEDHKVYYDEKWLGEIVDGTGWKLESYRSFQLGMNGFFKLKRVKE
jgi:hypothetical protein